MSASPEPGTPILVVQRSVPPKQWQGELIVHRDDTLAARIFGAPTAWAATGTYSIIWGTPGSRFVCSATFTARKGDVAAFRLTSNWSLIDLRRAVRFDVELAAEVRSVLGNSRQAGSLIDVSVSGAAVEVETRPGGSQMEVGLRANGYSARLLCDVVSTHSVGSKTVLHLRFRDMTPPQLAFVRQLVGQLIERQAS